MYQTRISGVALLVTALLAFNGCDSIFGGDDEPQLPEVINGISLQTETEELARYEFGRVQGEIPVPENGSSELITIDFIDGEGQHFQPGDEHFALGWEVRDSEAGQVTRQDIADPWQFRIELTGSSTQIRFLLINETDDEVEFESGWIRAVTQD